MGGSAVTSFLETLLAENFQNVSELRNQPLRFWTHKL